MAITPTQSNAQIPLTASQQGEYDIKPSLDVSGLDLSAIGNSIVRMTVPLRGGKFSLIAPHARAETKIYNNTVAKLSFGVNQLAGKPTIGSANLSFNPPIKIKNPAAAFKPTAGRFAKLVDVDYLKDKLADIIVHGIHVARDGRIHIDGYLKVGVLSKKPLSELLKPSDLTSLSGEPGKGLDLQKLLHDIGAVVEEATFSVESHANEERELALSALGVRAWTQKATAHAKLSGTLKLAHNDVHVRLDPKSGVRFGETRARMGGEMLVADVAQKPEVQAHVAFDVQPNGIHVKGSPVGDKEISLDLIDQESRLKGHAFLFRGKDGRIQVKDASSIDLKLAARAPHDLQLGNQQVYGKLQDLRLRAQLKANFSSDDNSFHIASGEAGAELTARNIEAVYQGIDVRAPGTYTLSASVPSFRYDSAKPSPTAQGEVNALAEMPGLDSFRSHLRFSVRDDGGARLNHTRIGVTEFLKPFVDLVPEQKREGITPGIGSAPIGSAEFESRCESLGKAQIRGNNHVELLIDGVESLPKRLDLINNAKKTIRMQTMVFKDDQAGAQVADALCAAVARGVDVKVIVDALGNAETFGDMIMMNPIYGHLRQGGVQLEIHNNSIGEGILEILGAISSNEKITEQFSIEDMSNPQKMFATLHTFAKAALNEHDIGLSADETQQLAFGLNRVLGAAKDETSLDRVRDLARITGDNVLELSEILELLKHNAHLNHRWHEKYLIVDSTEAIVGGVNSADEYLLGGTGIVVKVSDKTSEAWRDTDVYLKGDAVKDALAHFADNYFVLTGKTLASEDMTVEPKGDYRVQMVHSRPHVDGRSTILDLSVECLASLQRGDKAYLENAYFVPSGRTLQFEDALIEAAKRGVDVRVLMNSETSMDVKQVAHSAVFSQRRMLEGGVRVFERTGERMLHSKVAVFGSKVAAVGSWNADNRASSLNNESSAFVHDPRFAKKVEDMIVNDMKEGLAREIHLDDIAYLPLNTEIRNAGQALLGDLL